MAIVRGRLYGARRSIAQCHAHRAGEQETPCRHRAPAGDLKQGTGYSTAHRSSPCAELCRGGAMRAAWNHAARAASIVACFAGSAAGAQSSRPITVGGYGTVDFPTSTRSTIAQREFSRGVLLLHLFHYDEAADAFRQAEHADSSFAMAYWGEAMTDTHPVWDEQDRSEERRVGKECR